MLFNLFYNVVGVDFSALGLYKIILQKLVCRVNINVLFDMSL